MNYARIVDSIAVETWTDGRLGIVPAAVFVADLAAQFSAVPDEVQAGWVLKDGSWSAPESVETIANLGTIITRAAFRSRFTQAEKIAIELAGLDDPSAAIEARSQAAAIRTYQKDVDAAEFIDLTDPATAGGVQALEAAGLLAEGRAAEILTAPVQWPELPSNMQQSMGS